MDLNGKLYKKRVDSNEYTVDQRKCIEESIKVLEGLKKEPLMMLGKIQSGKTKTFIGTIALGFDNEYDLAVVLTKGTNALSQQTLSRMKNEFKGENVKIYDIMSMQKNLTTFELKQKTIIIVKKEKNNLARFKEFIESYPLKSNKKCMIIDDEADFASVGFEKKNEAFDIRKIAADINEIRGTLDECRFIQVTATPYSLYLQPETFELGTEIYPIKPAHTVLVPSGKGYIGGDYYFNHEENPLAQYLFEEVDQKEFDILKNSDRRVFKEEEVLTHKKISGIRKAVMNFIVGGTIRLLQNGGDEFDENNRYSLIIHTEIAKSSHTRQADIIFTLIEKFQELIENDKETLNKLILESLEDLNESINAYGFTSIDEETLKQEVYVAISERINISVVNSENEVKDMLDERGQLELRTPLNIFVGGQILDRGITISNLIGFVYGRRPQKMQQDTVLQHARMFGYRKPEDLAVTRLYTTKHLYNQMVKINEFDSALRKDFEEQKNKEGVIFIRRDVKGSIKPCSPNKIMVSKTHIIKEHRRMLPIGFTPKCKSKINPIVNKIDKIIMKENPSHKKQSEFTVNIDVAYEIVDLIYNTIDLDDNYSVDRETMLSLMNYVSKGKVHLIVREGRDTKKYTPGAGRLMNSPDNGTQDGIPAKRMAIHNPSLILIKQNGKSDEEYGWSGAPFWWPVLVTPKNVKSTVYAVDYMK
ncbi:Z1 domain-containing protein [Terrisporobacter petrolearius]|uniref:Z1 domain-containing protein n=1 Tax=Terrisporobacter petrolearius TaxID=1460447 RepID=UPI003AFF6954